MPATVIPFPRSYSRNLRRGSRTHRAKVIPLPALELSAFELYEKASAIDDDQPERAATLYRQAIESAQLHGESRVEALATTNTGNLFYKAGDHETAAEYYRKALELNPSQPEAHYNLGYIVLEQGEDLTYAHECLTRAIELDPAFADAYFNLAACYQKMERWTDAARAYRRYVMMQGNRPGISSTERQWLEIAKSSIKQLEMR